MTITEFLLARIAEDEELARGATRGPWRFGGMDNYHGPRDSRGFPIERFDGVFAEREAPLSQPILALPEYPVASGATKMFNQQGWADAAHSVRHQPDRVLAECEAKRRIIDEHPRCDVHDRPGDECDACQRCGDGSVWPCDTLLAVASVYADHPDFDPAWRAG